MAHFTFKKSILLFSLIISALCAAPQEFRAVYVEGSDWAQGDAAAMKGNISRIMKQSAENGLQAVFFVARDKGETFYPSQDELWSRYFSYRSPGFDPLAYAIQEAHNRGLQFHAVMDVLGCAQPTQDLPEDHISVKHNQWRLLDKNLETVIYNKQGLLKPYSPQVLSYSKKQLRELIKEYPVDGVQFKNLVFPHEAMENSDVFLIYSAHNKSMKMQQEDWAVQILDHMVEALSVQIKMIKPYLMVSAQCEPAYAPVKIKTYSGSALKNYHQDALAWLENASVDFISPVIYDKSKYFNDLMSSYLKNGDADKYIIPVCTGNEGGLISLKDLEREMNFLRSRGQKGIILSAAIDMLDLDLTDRLFRNKAVPPYLARTHHQVQAASLEMSKVAEPGDPARLTKEENWSFVDSQGNAAFISKKYPRFLSIKLPRTTVKFDTRNWRPPYNYAVKDRHEVMYPESYIELRKAPFNMTTDSSYSFLYTASPGNPRINDAACDQYLHSGVFFRELPLSSLGTRVRGSIESYGKTLFYEDIFYGNLPDTSTQHIVNIESVLPQGLVLLPQDEVCRLEFTSDIPDSIAAISLFASQKPVLLERHGKSYVANIYLEDYSEGDSLVIQVAARTVSGEDFAATLPVSIRILKRSEFPVLETSEDFTQLSYSQGQVRLGGPYFAEYPKGVRLVSDGKLGTHYRIRLDAFSHVFVDEKSVKEMPAGTPRPAYNLTTISVAPDSMKDVIYIPWPEAVPYRITPEPEQNRLRISLYGAECSSTWLSHKQGLQMVDHVEWEQSVDGRYDILLYLQDRPMWGYALEQKKKALVLTLKHEPERKKLRIAVEAGHGGTYNWGAVGLSGLREKDVNRDTADRLIALLKKEGYTVLNIREKDEGPYLRERWLKTDSLDADLLISIHANAAGGGYLRVGGTSTYYNNPFWKEFAQIGYDHLMELGLDEFGMVGSFNYMMVRMSQRPSILVEQAFMSHAWDEDKLADPAFRQRIAEKIGDSVDEYVERMFSR